MLSIARVALRSGLIGRYAAARAGRAVPRIPTAALPWRSAATALSTSAKPTVETAGQDTHPHRPQLSCRFSYVGVSTAASRSAKADAGGHRAVAIIGHDSAALPEALAVAADSHGELASLSPVELEDVSSSDAGTVHVFHREGARLLVAALHGDPCGDAEAERAAPHVTAEEAVAKLQAATHAVVAKAASLKIEHLDVAVPKVEYAGGRALPVAEVASIVTRVAMLSNWSFDRYLKKAPHAVDHLTIHCDPHASEEEVESVDEAVARSRMLAEATAYARDLANERGDVAGPAYMERAALSIAEDYGLSATVLDYDTLKREGLNMLAAVGQAARESPRLVAVEYHGDPGNADNVVALVGKGVTFDSGGLNLKPTGSIENMHIDMGGAAAVLGALTAVARMAVKVNVVAVIALAENAVDAHSYKPHAILRSYKGLTVEVGNTDAEGRLCLADALTWVQKVHGPQTVVDVATLTGACVVGLGEYAAGLFGNDDSLGSELAAAGAVVDEMCWPMPILREHAAELKSKFADSSSTGKGRYGGACTAAAFLQQFVEDDVQWAHLDIAGPAMRSSPSGHRPQGGTGFGAALLAQWLIDSAK